jgi:alcohol dehydrogenase (cytochrome c)
MSTSSRKSAKFSSTSRSRSAPGSSKSAALYTSTPYVNTAHFTIAFDAATCAKDWQYTVQFIAHTIQNNNRGSTYLDGMIFRGAPDGQLIALDATTGAKVWSVQTRKPGETFETLVSATIAWKGKVFIGIALGDLPITGRLMALTPRAAQNCGA